MDGTGILLYTFICRLLNPRYSKSIVICTIGMEGLGPYRYMQHFTVCSNSNN
ncbi:MAG: hypothetical protein R6U11_00275 [Bacteroidales bacterium]